jgi:hypothetical protein
MEVCCLVGIFGSKEMGRSSGLIGLLLLVGKDVLYMIYTCLGIGLRISTMLS